MKTVICAAVGIAALAVASFWLIQEDSAVARPVAAVVPAQSAPKDIAHQSLASATAPPGLQPSASQNANAVARAPAAAAMPLPEEIPVEPASSRSRVELWERPTGNGSIEIDGVPATRLQVDPAVLRALQVGQTLDLEIPPLNKTVSAELVSTHNQLNKVHIFKGPLIDGHKTDNVLVSRGESSTYVVVATAQGVFSAVIDNVSGEAVLTDESEINRRMSNQDDAVTVPPMDMPLPGN